MRILKRNLAFVLALVMALSLTVSAMNVADYTDADEITFVEAVDVLSAMGILEGTDGVFNPNKVLNRAEAAKIIAFLMLGKNSAANLTTGTAPFADVPANHWAAGYIAHCVNEGIIGGYGNGNFGPDDELTATAFAKMLLCACGYGVNGEFTGANWEVEVNKLALKLGVFNGNLGVNFAAGCEREEAALYAFNTLMNVETVKYSELMGSYYAGATFFDTNSGTTLNKECGYNYSKSYSADAATDAFGRQGYVWVNAKNKVMTGVYGVEADAVYTTAVAPKTIYADLGLTEAVNATVIVDGKPADALNLNKTTKTNWALSGNGVLVEVYAEEVKEIVNDEWTGDYVTDVKIIVVNTYVAKVGTVNEKTGKTTVTITNVPANTNATFETTEFAKNDIVLVTLAYDNAATNAKYQIQTMELAEAVEGTMTGLKSGSYIKLDGEQYNYGKLFNTNLNDAEFVANVLYVDNYGYAMYVEKTADSAVDVDGYVKVTATALETDKFGDATGAIVKVTYFADGEEAVLSLPVEKKVPTGSNGTAKVLCYKTIAVDGKTATWTALGDTDPALSGVYGYTMTENDEIVLVNLDSNKVKHDTGVSVEFDGKRVAKGGFVAGLRLNTATVATIVDNGNVDTYEGYADIDFKASNVEVLAIVDGAMLKEVYVLGGVGTTADDYVTVYYADDAEKLNTTGKYLYTVYGADGETYNYVYEGVLATNTAYNLYIKTTDVANADGEIDSIKNTHTLLTISAIDEENGEWIKIGTTTRYFAEDVTVWNVVDGIAAVTVDSVEVNDKVSYDVAEDGAIIAIFIIENAPVAE